MLLKHEIGKRPRGLMVLKPYSVRAFASARPDRFAWKDRKWEWAGLVPESAQFETPSGIDLEARDRWFAQAIVTSPAMFRRTAGAGWFTYFRIYGPEGPAFDGSWKPDDLRAIT